MLHCILWNWTCLRTSFVENSGEDLSLAKAHFTPLNIVPSPVKIFMTMDDYGCLWKTMDDYGCLWIIMCDYGWLWVTMDELCPLDPPQYCAVTFHHGHHWIIDHSHHWSWSFIITHFTLDPPQYCAVTCFKNQAPVYLVFLHGLPGLKLHFPTLW